jgi:transcriptional regulator of met regulon
LFKKIERVESIMFLYFLALMIQALIEREVRDQMKAEEINQLPIYPEFRGATHPTSSKIFEAFQGLSTYKLFDEKKLVKEFRDEFNEPQRQVLSLLGITPETYWGQNATS